MCQKREDVTNQAFMGNATLDPSRQEEEEGAAEQGTQEVPVLAYRGPESAGTA